MHHNSHSLFCLPPCNKNGELSVNAFSIHCVVASRFEPVAPNADSNINDVSEGPLKNNDCTQYRSIPSLLPINQRPASAFSNNFFKPAVRPATPSSRSARRLASSSPSNPPPTLEPWSDPTPHHHVRTPTKNKKESQ